MRQLITEYSMRKLQTSLTILFSLTIIYVCYKIIQSQTSIKKNIKGNCRHMNLQRFRKISRQKKTKKNENTQLSLTRKPESINEIAFRNYIIKVRIFQRSSASRPPRIKASHKFAERVLISLPVLIYKRL